MTVTLIGRELVTTWVGVDLVETASNVVSQGINVSLEKGKEEVVDMVVGMTNMEVVASMVLIVMVVGAGTLTVVEDQEMISITVIDQVHMSCLHQVDGIFAII
ncbi:unnamed protein product [Fraxinus pennsylvanica]|uniref:Uncharacterized protein n=1 Tax=Fraxinus pennsylvanica TaxID=56036 RepID=A0AAD1YN57_9LAMI|nr:unnamed protein product [Fraxinus pennsylvanica]